MRGSSRRRHQEDEEESAFVSMTDLTVSFLFIIMILLAYAASKMSGAQMVTKASYDLVIAQRDAIAREKARLEEYLGRILELAELRRRQIDDLETRLSEIEKRVTEVTAQRELIAREKALLEDELKRTREISDAQRLRIQELEQKIAELIRRLAEKNPLETYIAEASEARRRLLEELQAKLKIDIPDLQVEVSEQMDALRFKGDGLFQLNEFALSREKARIVSGIAVRLNKMLPCFTIGPYSQWSQECNGIGAIIEAVQIEGHTDSTGNENANLTLSTNRANSTFFVMKDREPNITRHLNARHQPVMSVAGYGGMRPIGDNTTSQGQATNRRIDLRIIMYTPRDFSEIESIRKALREGLR